MKKIIFTLSIISLFFCPVIAYSQEPSPPLAKGQPGKVQTERSTKSNIQAKNNDNTTNKSVIELTPKPTSEKSQSSTKNSYEKNSDRRTRWKSPISRYTFWIMLFTGLLVLCNILLWCSTRKSANAAKEAANAAKKSVDTIPTIERAYIYVSSVSADFESWRHVKVSQLSPISIEVHNYGKTPAKLVGIITKIQIGKSDGIKISWEIPDDEEIIDSVGRFIASNSKESFFYYMHSAIGDGDYHIIFSGEVRYRDIFERDHIAYFNWVLVARFQRGFYINNPEANYTT